MTFSKKTKIRFKHCDMAGIVFYPRYFEMLNDLVEDWLNELNYGFLHIHHPSINVGVPAVNIVCDFKKPSYLDEIIEKELYISKLGNSSCSLKVFFRSKQTKEVKVEISLTIVHINLKEKKATPWDKEVKLKMQKYLQL